MHIVPHHLLDEWARSDPPRLLAVAHEQADWLVELSTLVETLSQQRDQAQSRVHELEVQVEELQRAVARQAAPFRIPDEKRAAAPRRPGRKPGHPGFYCHIPDHVDEHVEVPLAACPRCGGPIHNRQRIEQYIEELPPVRPYVLHLITWQADCPHCRRQVRSTQPWQVSTATGAAGIHLGPRALATATWLNKAHGLTMRKTTILLETLFSLRLSPGGLALALHRVGQRLQPDYQALRATLPQLPAVYTDETSRWIGGPNAWLRVFAVPTCTVYILDDQRDRATVIEVLSRSFAGVLVSDCLNIYDDATPLQHKCYAHHHKAIARAMRSHPLGGQGYLQEVRALLHAAQALKLLPPAQWTTADGTECRQTLDQNADRLLAAPRSDPAEERVRQRLFKQRDHLFTFLDHTNVDATNNLAERQLRPGVIARKLSCGNKTRRGADTWQIIASLSATWRQRHESFFDHVTIAVSLATRMDTS